MRFLIAGLVMIGLGIGLSEWSVRHPPEKSDKKDPSTPKVAETPKAISLEELLKSETCGAEVRDGSVMSAVEQRVKVVTEKPGVAPEGTTALMGNEVFRGLAAHEKRAYVVVEEGKAGVQQGVLGVGPAGGIAVTGSRPGISAIASWERTVYWAEEKGVFARTDGGDGAPRCLVRLPNAKVTALAVNGESLVLAVVPKGTDPFSTDPVGAVLAVMPGREGVVVLATKLQRLSEVLTDGKRAFWVSGYPSGVQTAGLTGDSTPSELAARGGGPLALAGDSLVFRLTTTGAPELMKVALEGGTAVSLAATEADRVVARGEDLFFSVGPELKKLPLKGGAPVLVRKFDEPVLELGSTEEGLVVLTRQATGAQVLLRVVP